MCRSIQRSKGGRWERRRHLVGILLFLTGSVAASVARADSPVGLANVRITGRGQARVTDVNGQVICNDQRSIAGSPAFFDCSAPRFEGLGSAHAELVVTSAGNTITVTAFASAVQNESTSVQFFSLIDLSDVSAEVVGDPVVATGTITIQTIVAGQLTQAVLPIHGDGQVVQSGNRFRIEAANAGAGLHCSGNTAAGAAFFRTSTANP